MILHKCYSDHSLLHYDEKDCHKVTNIFTCDELGKLSKRYYGVLGSRTWANFESLFLTFVMPKASFCIELTFFLLTLPLYVIPRRLDRRWMIRALPYLCLEIVLLPNLVLPPGEEIGQD